MKNIISKRNYFFKLLLISTCLVFLFIILIKCTSKDKNKENTQFKTDSLSTAKERTITELKFLNKRVNFGNVPEDTVLFSKFRFVNSGENKLIINYVNPDCICTGYTLSNDTVMAGDTAYIELEFNTEGKYGDQKVYTIVSANTKNKLYKLTLLANVNAQS